MINPEMIHSVREVAGGWQVFQCGLPTDSCVYSSRDEACDRARYLNGVEEEYYPTLTRVAQLVDALRRQRGLRRADAQQLVERVLSGIREADDAELAAVASGRSLHEVR
jgi:hypothetical protein